MLRCAPFLPALFDRVAAENGEPFVEKTPRRSISYRPPVEFSSTVAVSGGNFCCCYGNAIA